MPHQDPEARRKYQREWYQKNKKSVIPKVMERNKRYHAEQKQLVKEIKESSPCADCGESHPYYVMQFDHVADDKIGNVADMLRDNVGRLKLLDEIAKCEIVCSNCHAERTHMRRNHAYEAQLEERSFETREATGSIPVVGTMGT